MDGWLDSKFPDNAVNVKDVPPVELFSICGPSINPEGELHWARIIDIRSSGIHTSILKEKKFISPADTLTIFLQEMLLMWGSLGRIM